MFPQVLLDFEDRVKEVDLYFQLLLSLDNDEIQVVKGTGSQTVPEGRPPAEWSSMLKGAAYLVLYNLVEAFVRRGFQAVFDTIRSEGVSGSELIEVLRDQWMAQRNRVVKHFDGSPKVYMKISSQIIKDVIARQVASMSHAGLPISGNIDADVVREVCLDHGVALRIPAAAKGGIALATVRVKRNALSHGDESFAEAGRSLVAITFVSEKNEIVLFMRSVLTNLEKYATDRAYKV